MKIILIIFCVAVQAMATVKVAVVEITTGKNIFINQNFLRFLADILRTNATNSLPDTNFVIMTRENIDAFVNDTVYINDKGLVSLGRAIGAKYIVGTTIGRYNDGLTLTMELYETQSGNKLDGLEEKAKNLNELEKIIREKSHRIFSKIKVPVLGSLSGSLKFAHKNSTINAVLQEGSELPIYKLSESFFPGTRLRLYFSNNEASQAYFLGSDLTGIVTKIGNHNLMYKSNVRVPGDNFELELDNNIGENYILLLYSKIELPIENIITRIENAEGNFAKKVKSALEGDLISIKEITSAKQEIKFSSESQKPVLAIIVEITTME